MLLHIIIDRISVFKSVFLFLDLQFNLNKINSSLEEKIFDLFLLLEKLPWNSLERNRSWKLVIMSIGDEKVGDIFRKWLGFSTTKRTKNGVSH